MSTYVVAGDMATRSALAYGSMKTGIIATITIDAKQFRAKWGIGAAMRHLRTTIEEWLSDQILWPHVVAYELPTIAGYKSALAQYGAVASLLDASASIPSIPVWPSQLKKYATGNGRASKQDMIEMAEQYWNRSVDGNHDLADAILIFKYACDFIQKGEN